MAKKSVTFAELIATLAGLGYRVDPEQSAEGYSVYKHAARPLPIILQSFKPSAPVRPIYLVAVRNVLAENSTAEAEAFGAWLDGRAALGPREVPVR